MTSSEGRCTLPGLWSRVTPMRRSCSRQQRHCAAWGGLILGAHGKRSANGLGRRDYVTGETWKNRSPFRLVLNKPGGRR